jgi:hypothetical protein
MKLYQVITGNYLNNTKRIFQRESAACRHIREIIKRKPKWVSLEDVNNSYRVTIIDTAECPQWDSVFKVSDKEAPPEAPKKNELSKRIKDATKQEANSVDTGSD